MAAMVMVASAMLKTLKPCTAIQSVTCPKITLSMRLPAAPPARIAVIIFNVGVNVCQSVKMAMMTMAAMSA